MTVQYAKGLAPDYFSRPSQSIWGDCPVDALVNKRASGIYLFEDFSRAPLSVVPGAAIMNYMNGWKAYSTATNPTVAPLSTPHGAGIVATTTADNEVVSLQTNQCPFNLDSDRGPLWFETRWKVGCENASTNSNHAGVFVGLASAATLGASVPLVAAGGAMATSISFVGFHRVEGDFDNLDTPFCTASGSKTDVGTNVISSTAGVHTAAGALAADVFIKTGMKYHPKDRLLRFYVNGVELADTVSVEASGFPDNVQLGLIAAMLSQHADDNTLSLAWIGGAQLDYTSAGG